MEREREERERKRDDMEREIFSACIWMWDMPSQRD